MVSAAGNPDNSPPGGGSDGDTPWAALVQKWVDKIKLGIEHKKAKFDEVAKEAMQFYNGGTALADYMYGKGRKGFVTPDDEGNMPCPTFRYTMNKVSEVVQLFGPTLYHKNPARLVTPRQFKPVPPEVFAAVMQLQQPAPLPMPQPGPSPGPGAPPGQMPGPDPAQMMQMMLQQMSQQQAAQSAQQDSIENAVESERAEMMSTYLNYTPNENDLKTHSRRVIDEALIKGMGCWWTEIVERPGFEMRIVGSFYDSVDNLIIDPDAETIEECNWIVRSCLHPQWEIEDEYGLPRDSLKKGRGLESVDSQAEQKSDKTGDLRLSGTTNDLKRYYKIYSKMGMGGRLSDFPEEYRDQFDEFGDNCFLVVCPGIKYPLNLHPGITTPPSQEEIDAAQQQAQAMLSAAPDPGAMAGGMPGQPPPEPPPDPMQEYKDQLFEAAQWPIPFWADGTWPMTPLYFHGVPNCSWPQSHIAPGMAELKFLNWCMSFLMGKVHSSCRTIIAGLKSLEEEIRAAVLNGPDQSFVGLKEADGTNDINKLISYLQQPEFHKDIYEVLDRVAQDFDKRVGLSEILYGLASTQSRSATDVNVRQTNANVRLDDMANKVEDAMTALARKEAIAASTVLQQKDLQPVLGPQRTILWGKLIQSEQLETVVRELDYRIEAGSVKKPNFNALTQNAQVMTTGFGPFFQQLAMQTGQVGPLNALLSLVCRANDIDPGPFLVQPPPPPPPPMPGPPTAGAPGQPGPGGPPHPAHPAPVAAHSPGPQLQHAA